MIEWISVKDRLPEDGQTVLLYGRRTYCCELDAEENYGIYQAEHVNNNLYCSECYKCDSSTNYEFVTHWMPLPTMPAEGLSFASPADQAHDVLNQHHVAPSLSDDDPFQYHEGA
jgi:hypothetical protein